ncbi:ribbon-helix-helix domain-containing protein [Vreelandella sedimenti]|uniref:ribbon-helix-helix domain-containing protein n=1 Tax=Vreelandella sedimenti TaxID=2729618 RepID=UPI0035303D64
MHTYRTQVRFPDQSLAERIKREAESQQRSMNAQILHLIKRGLDSEQKAAG